MLTHAEQAANPAALVVDVGRFLLAPFAARSGVQELLPQRSVFAKTSMAGLADRRDARTGLAGEAFGVLVDCHQMIPVKSGAL